MNQVSSQSERIGKLQQEILSLQGFRRPLESERMDTGLGIMNKAFPNSTFPVNAVHEFLSDTKENAAATTGFMAGLLHVLMPKGACLWVSTTRTLFPPALQLFGVTPDQVIFVDVTNNRDALWVIEEGLKADTLAAVVGEIKDLSFTESRRLQLAVEASHVTGFIHRNMLRSAQTVACVSRWKVTPLKSLAEEGMPGVGFPQWNVELSKIRNGKPGVWQVEWNRGGFSVAGQMQPVRTVTMRKAG